MSKLSQATDYVKGSIASLQTLLERYPILVTTTDDASKTSFSFMLNILETIGVTQEEILQWMSRLLTDSEDGTQGILSTLETAIKNVILLTFRETYTCSVNPILPDDVMKSLYDTDSESVVVDGNGIEVELQAIDPFGLLNYCPIDPNESIFYFDSYGKYNAHTVYKSSDFNAFLWYILNRSNFRVPSERLKCIWDNRNFYYARFAINNDESAKDSFFTKMAVNAPTVKVKGVGTKRQYFACEYIENYSSGRKDASKIKIYLNADRYYKTGILGTNKTIFEFNVDYVNSIRMFDAKTFVARVINAVLGFANSSTYTLSLERRVAEKRVRAIIQKIIEAEDTMDTSACYYSFTNDEYEKMLSASEIEKKGKYPSGNENNDLITIDTAFTIEQLYKIEDAENLEEREKAVENAFVSTAKALASTDETEDKYSFSFEYGIIGKFIKELSIELAMQALSPEIVLLYAINERIMGKQDGAPMDIISFLKKFENMIVNIVRNISELILKRLYDFLMGLIKPLIVLFLQKLLLEKIMYYRMVLEDLLSLFNLRKRETLNIDNVFGADIIPELKSPEEGCRT